MPREDVGQITNCNVAVIGGAGFLGSHLVEYLINKRNCRVLVIDSLVTGLRRHVPSECSFLQWDISQVSDSHIGAHLQARGIQWVFNYAAEPYIPECFDNPTKFFLTNAVGALNVINACQLANVKGLLQVSSAEIYGDAKGKVTEDCPVTPHSTYGVTKMAADGLVQVRWREAKVPVIALRQFNCVGERETHEYVIPEIISQIFQNQMKDRATINLGNDSTRDFLYAGDAVRMAVELLEKGHFGEVYNMGSERAIGIYELARTVGDLMEVTVNIKQDPARVRPWEIWHLQSDNTKLYGAISGRPTVSLEEALRKTIAYFHNNNCQWNYPSNTTKEARYATAS